MTELEMWAVISALILLSFYTLRAMHNKRREQEG